MKLSTIMAAEQPLPSAALLGASRVECKNLLPLSHGYDIGALTFELSPPPTDLLSLRVIVGDNVVKTCWLDCKVEGEIGVCKTRKFVLDDAVLNFSVSVRVATRILGLCVGDVFKIPAMPMPLEIETKGTIVQRGKSVHIYNLFRKVNADDKPKEADVVCFILRQPQTGERHLIPMEQPFVGVYFIASQRVDFTTDSTVVTCLQRNGFQISLPVAVDKVPQNDAQNGPAIAKKSVDPLDKAESAIEPINPKASSEHKRKRSDETNLDKEKPVKKARRPGELVKVRVSGLRSMKASGIDKMGVIVRSQSKTYHNDGWCIDVGMTYEDALIVLENYKKQRAAGDTRLSATILP